METISPRHVVSRNVTVPVDEIAAAAKVFTHRRFDGQRAHALFRTQASRIGKGFQKSSGRGRGLETRRNCLGKRPRDRERVEKAGGSGRRFEATGEGGLGVALGLGCKPLERGGLWSHICSMLFSYASPMFTTPFYIFTMLFPYVRLLRLCQENMN